MSRDFEQETRRALDAIHQWEKDINELGKGLSSIEFHDTIAADFERMEAVEAESARRKIAAERGSIQTAETLQTNERTNPKASGSDTASTSRRHQRSPIQQDSRIGYHRPFRPQLASNCSNWSDNDTIPTTAEISESINTRVIRRCMPL